MQWFKKAAKQNNFYAQYNIGYMYEYGNGVSKNKKKAIAWYKKAAKQGHKSAKEKVKKLTKK